MMEKSVFEFLDYKAYLISKIGKTGTRSGGRSSIARLLSCNTAYISQILNNNSHLSLEQGEKLNDFFEHTEDEGHFFLLLIQFNRAGTKNLKKYFKIQIDKVIEQRLNLQKRLGVKTSLSEVDQATYYSTWYYAAIHVALSIPSLNHADALADYFDLPLKKVKGVLNFLVSVGLAQEKSGIYSVGPTYIHLNSASENILRHHTNWRLKALEFLDKDLENDVHYASSITLSKKDVFKIKNMIIENIKNMNQIISKSPEEEVYCFTTDFFLLGNK